MDVTAQGHERLLMWARRPPKTFVFRGDAATFMIVRTCEYIPVNSDCNILVQTSL